MKLKKFIEVLPSIADNILGLVESFKYINGGLDKEHQLGRNGLQGRNAGSGSAEGERQEDSE